MRVSVRARMCVCMHRCMDIEIHRSTDNWIHMSIPTYPLHTCNDTPEDALEDLGGEREWLGGMCACRTLWRVCVRTHIFTCTHPSPPRHARGRSRGLGEIGRRERERLAPGRGALSPDSFRGQKASRRTTSDRKSPLLTKHPPWTRSSAATIRRRSTPVADTSRCLHLVT